MKNCRIHKSRTKKRSGVRNKMDFISSLNPKYRGCFVAITNETEPRVLAANKNCGTVIDKARKVAQESPWGVIFVPKKGTIAAF